ncbi:hypothetical protein D623_10035791 [Myotis brandtii]|uniref:Uncharacterized protein n=1 Tax=Myotis brandtii TaxID=109478 RepID=S7MDY6_MYOBR|nr:hypothetical protein D623_10035791 [Myotis brandtii]
MRRGCPRCGKETEEIHSVPKLKSLQLFNYLPGKETEKSSPLQGLCQDVYIRIQRHPEPFAVYIGTVR